MTKGNAGNFPSAGLVAGCAAVVVNQGVGYAAVPWICASRLNLVPGLALVCALLALAGAFLSWRALRPVPAHAEGHAGGAPYSFLAGVSALFALLCAAVVLSQGAAGLVLDGCER